VDSEIPPYNSDANGDPIGNLYSFPSSDVSTTYRLRRVEKAVPYLRSGTSVDTSSSVTGVATNAVSSGGQLDLAASSVIKTGSTPPSGVTGLFTATATTTTITWYWDGTNGSSPLVIQRADGSFFAVPRGSITIGGLVANTTYYFLPFWSTVGGCQIGWVIGTVGLPQIAFVSADVNSANAQYYLMQQQLQNREQLTAGFMSYTTPVSGSSSGGGGGGGKIGSCVMTGTFIDPIGDYGSMRVTILPCNLWICIQTRNGKYVYVTPDHPIYACPVEDKEEMEKAMGSLTEENLEKFKIQAQDTDAGMFIITEEGISEIMVLQPFHRSCTKRAVHLERGHLFWANGILSHNKMNNGGF